MSNSNDVLVAAISTVGGALATVLTYLAGRKVQNGRSNSKPKDRMEVIFDGYENLIDQMRDEIKNLRKNLITAEKRNNQLEWDLDRSEARCQQLEAELKQLRQQYRDLERRGK